MQSAFFFLRAPPPTKKKPFFSAVKSQWRQVGGEPDNKKYRMEAAFASSSIPHTLVGRDFLFSATCPNEPLPTGTVASGCASGCFGPSANCIGTTCTCGRGYSRVGSNQVSGGGNEFTLFYLLKISLLFFPISVWQHNCQRRRQRRCLQARRRLARRIRSPL